MRAGRGNVPSQTRTLQVVRSVSELQGEEVVGGAVGVQRAGHLPAADEAVLAAQHDDRTVDQLHDELLRLTWRPNRSKKCFQLQNKPTNQNSTHQTQD